MGGCDKLIGEICDVENCKDEGYKECFGCWLILCLLDWYKVVKRCVMV